MRYISLLFLLTFCGSTRANTEITPSFTEGTGHYNIGETVVLKCMIKTADAPALGFKQTWYKKQDGGFHMVGEDKNILSEPFNANENNYFIDFKSDRKTKMTNFTLTINAVQAVDIGEYKCKVGYPDELETIAESTELSLRIKPATQEPEDLSFTTDARSDGSIMIFNTKHPVKCSVSSSAISEDLQLAIQLKDGTDISQNFVLSSEVTWAGAVGLRQPKTTHELSNEWMPKKAGTGELSCIYSDGNRRLNRQYFEYRRDETTSINCTSNAAAPVKENDLDLYINCKVYDFGGNWEEVDVQWTFMYEDETAVLKTGEDKFEREAGKDGDQYTLFMPRVPRDMTKYGKVFEYKVLLYKKDTGEDLAGTTYGVAVDNTSPIKAGAANLRYTLPLLLVQLLLSL